MRAVGIAPMLFILTLAVAGFSGGESKERAGDTGSPALEPPAVVEISEQTRDFRPWGLLVPRLALRVRVRSVSAPWCFFLCCARPCRCQPKRVAASS